MGVNIASIREYYFKPREKKFKSFLLNFLPPAIGFIICLIIWLNLTAKTFIIGGSWMLKQGLSIWLFAQKVFEKTAPPS
jgi:hypothetical protein